MDYKKFYEYFENLYGEGLEVANWHLNGDLEPLDNFIDYATDYACGEEKHGLKDYIAGIVWKIGNLFQVE